MPLTKELFTVSFATRLCIYADLTAAVFLLFASLRSGQDLATKMFVIIPILHLIGCVSVALILLQRHRKMWALVMSGLPAVITTVLLAISFA